MAVCTFLADGFETVEALAVIDILRRAKIAVDTISISDSKMVSSAQGIKVEADYILKDYRFDGTEVLFLPGGPGHTKYFECDNLLDLLQRYNRQGNRLAAICAAPSVFGELGIVSGKKAIAFPGFEDRLLGATVVEGARVVTDGNVTTSRGMGTSIDLGLELVRLLKGKDEADKLAKSTQYV